MKSLPDAFIFMKVGSHAGETFEEIIARKQREIDIAGVSLWGYGGPTLHPIRQVQPFARLTLSRTGSIYLLMEPMNSRANPELLPAKEMSVDGVTWEPLPEGIRVTGSRYALVLNRIEPGSLDFDPEQYEVALGPSTGRAASEYLRGHVDKGCFVRRADGLSVPIDSTKKVRTVGFTADLDEPYGVVLR